MYHDYKILRKKLCDLQSSNAIGIIHISHSHDPSSEHNNSYQVTPPNVQSKRNL